MIQEALFEACRAAPDDDGPRLVLADAIGGDRGEVIVVQCAIARGGLSAERAGALRRRERELIAANGVAWSGLRDLAKRVSFRRGFVDAVELDADMFVAYPDDLFDSAPLAHNILLTGMVAHTMDGGLLERRSPGWMLPAAFALPAIARLDGLYLGPVGTLSSSGSGVPWYSDEDRAIELAISSGALANLRTFGAAGLRVETVDKLIAAGALARIERLHTASPPATVDRMLAHTPSLCALTAVNAVPDPLPAGLTELHLGVVNWLTRPRLPDGLEHLAVDLRRVDVECLAHLTRLRVLHLTDVVAPLYDPPGLAAELEALSLPALRVFRASALAVPVAFAIAKRFGPQLELLDLRGSAAELHARRDELQALVAGDVRTGAFEDLRELAFLGGPSIDAAIVELPR